MLKTKKVTKEITFDVYDGPKLPFIDEDKGTITFLCNSYSEFYKCYMGINGEFEALIYKHVANKKVESILEETMWIKKWSSLKGDENGDEYGYEWKDIENCAMEIFSDIPDELSPIDIDDYRACVVILPVYSNYEKNVLKKRKTEKQ